MPILSILAQTPYQNRLEGLRGAFDDRKTDPTDITGFFILFGCVIAIALIWVIARRISVGRSTENEHNHPVRLFDMILRKMGIGFRDRFVLKLFARGVNLPSPMLIFFDEEVFDRHAGRWIDSLSFTPLKRRAMAGIELLRSRSFPDTSAAKAR
ncbi:MAG: hypothetical protein H6818_09695 [Phycisphaerales bacterium]|nr:hypothetical protein [Phycisphaerales bacterium]MCB9864073.1 hypothetical protein [Phycisphaerales bacterium]